MISRLKCWQLNISIHISWKSGYPEFSWGVNYWGVPYISLYTSNLPEIKIYRTLKEYLSFQENWTFYLKSNYLYQLLFLVQVHILYLCMSPCQVMSTNTPSKQLRKICVRWKCWQFYLSINNTLKKRRFRVLVDLQGAV